MSADTWKALGVVTAFVLLCAVGITVAVVQAAAWLRIAFGAC